MSTIISSTVAAEFFGAVRVLQEWGRRLYDSGMEEGRSVADLKSIINNVVFSLPLEAHEVLGCPSLIYERLRDQKIRDRDSNAASLYDSKSSSESESELATPERARLSKDIPYREQCYDSIPTGNPPRPHPYERLSKAIPYREQCYEHIPGCAPALVDLECERPFAPCAPAPPASPEYEVAQVLVEFSNTFNGSPTTTTAPSPSTSHSQPAPVSAPVLQSGWRIISPPSPSPSTAPSPISTPTSLITPPPPTTPTPNPTPSPTPEDAQPTTTTTTQEPLDFTVLHDLVTVATIASRLQDTPSPSPCSCSSSPSPSSSSSVRSARKRTRDDDDDDEDEDDSASSVSSGSSSSSSMSNYSMGQIRHAKKQRLAFRLPYITSPAAAAAAAGLVGGPSMGPIPTTQAKGKGKAKVTAPTPTPTQATNANAKVTKAKSTQAKGKGKAKAKAQTKKAVQTTPPASAPAAGVVKRTLRRAAAAIGAGLGRPSIAPPAIAAACLKTAEIEGRRTRAAEARAGGKRKCVRWVEGDVEMRVVEEMLGGKGE